MYQTFFPPKDLENFVSFFYVMEKEVDDLSQQLPELLMPSGTSIMGFHYAGNWKVDFTEKKVQKSLILPDFYTVGQQTVSYNLTITEAYTGIFGMTLKPSALWHLLKVPAKTFTNNPLDSRIVWGKAFLPLAKTFKTLKKHSERQTLVETFIREQINKAKHFPTWVDTAIDYIFKNKGCVSAKELQKYTGLSERTLQRAFVEQVGVSPKQYARIMRFNNLFLEIAKPRAQMDLSFISSFYNYHDASHLNKDFKNYCGIAPSAFVLEQFRLLDELVSDIPYLIQVQERNRT